MGGVALGAPDGSAPPGAMGREWGALQSIVSHEAVSLIRTRPSTWWGHWTAPSLLLTGLERWDCAPRPDWLTRIGSSTCSQVTALRKGAPLLKYCRGGKPHVCLFKLSADEARLTWQSRSNKVRAHTLPSSGEACHALCGQLQAFFP